MTNLIESLRGMSDDIAKQKAADFEYWTKREKKDKNGLENLLANTISLISFQNSGTKRLDYIFCSSNPMFLKMFSALKSKTKNKTAFLKQNGIRIKDKNKVGTWDLITDSYKTILLNNWQVEDIITLNADNIDLIISSFKTLLKLKEKPKL